ncbi:MAG: hypothetical protein M3O22_02630 [Pseudomonadota bacterium]|nr:hypothetical protein [Pseudomonadota bacterium]
MKKIVVLALAGLALSACSTIVEGRSQQLYVNTNPAGAECDLTRQGMSIGRVNPTPGAIMVEKTKHDITVTCKKSGYQTATYINKSDVAGATVGNVILGGGIGWAIDSATGSDNKYETPMNITLAR